MFREKKTHLHLVYIHLGKSYDMISREIIWHIFQKKTYSALIYNAVKDMYNRTVTNVQYVEEGTYTFPITPFLN